jgi:hypothetical protein
MAFVRDALVRKSFSGSIDFELPTAVEPAVQVARLSLPVGGEGVYRLSGELLVGSRMADATELDLELSAASSPERRRRPLPGYLADRLVDRDSLRTDARGLSVELLNQTRPAALTAVHGLTLDGDPVDPQHVLAEISGRTLPLPKRLELPMGRRVRLLVDLGAPLRAGRHTLELDLTVAGVASGKLRVQGFVAPEELRPAGSPR